MYYLRSYRSRAIKEHFCDYCFLDILPGDEYEATVYRTSRKRIMVLKKHKDPLCPNDPTFDHWDEEWKDDDRGEEWKEAA